MAFCGIPPPCLADLQENSKDQPDASIPVSRSNSLSAVVCTGVIWEKREVLKVHFLNPEVVQKWGLTTATILEWANGTPEQEAWGEIMTFEESKNIKRADIRVEFSGR